MSRYTGGYVHGAEEWSVSVHTYGSGETLMRRQEAGRSQTDRGKLGFVRL